MVLKLLKRSIARMVTKPSPIRHVTVLIQVPKVPDGIVDVGPRLVMNDYFITPAGKHKNAFTDKADVENAAAAAMKMLRFGEGSSDYEIVNLKPDHNVRKYYVVWFPKADEFDSWALLHEYRIRLLTPKMTMLHEAIRLAEEQHKRQ